MYAKCRRIDEARKMFDRMPNRELMVARMQEDGKRPDSISPPPPPLPQPLRPPHLAGRISLYHPSLLPLMTCKSMRELLQIQAHLIIAGLFSDPFAASRILKFSAESGPIDYTLLLLRHIPSADAFCVNTALKALSRSHDPHAAVPFYFEMLRAGFVPNSFTFPPLANACARAPSLDDGEKCHGQAVKRGAAGFVHVGNSLIHMYASCGLADSARILFDEMLERDLVSWNAMVDGYLKLGNLASASALFNQMPERNVVSWNVMIGGYLRCRNADCGLKLFREMVEEGLRGSETTMVSVVTACGRLGLLREGMSVHGYFIRNFVEKNLIVGTALVDMYSKCRRVDVAGRVFYGMPERNLVCWNAMVLGQCIHGNPEDGLEVFKKMVGRGESSETGVTDGSGIKPTRIKPDEITFVGVLCACARAGLLAEGKEYFNHMTSLYNVTPTFAHYWCMANLYGSLGLVQEAEDVLKSMPEESESLVWSYLFGLCRFRGDIKLGESIAKRLIELEPFNGSRYALLWNVYAAAGRWEDAHKVKETMKERGLRVMHGYNLLDFKEIVHDFKVGDRSHPEIEKIYVMMDDLATMLKLTTAAPGSILSGHG